MNDLPPYHHLLDRISPMSAAHLLIIRLVILQVPLCRMRYRGHRHPLLLEYRQLARGSWFRGIDGIHFNAVARRSDVQIPVPKKNAPA